MPKKKKTDDDDDSSYCSVSSASSDDSSFSDSSFSGGNAIKERGRNASVGTRGGGRRRSNANAAKRGGGGGGGGGRKNVKSSNKTASKSSNGTGNSSRNANKSSAVGKNNRTLDSSFSSSSSSSESDSDSDGAGDPFTFRKRTFQNKNAKKRRGGGAPKKTKTKTRVGTSSSSSSSILGSDDNDNEEKSQSSSRSYSSSSDDSDSDGSVDSYGFRNKNNKRKRGLGGKNGGYRSDGDDSCESYVTADLEKRDVSSLTPTTAKKSRKSSSRLSIDPAAAFEELTSSEEEESDGEEDEEVAVVDEGFGTTRGNKSGNGARRRSPLRDIGTLNAPSDQSLSKASTAAAAASSSSTRATRGSTRSAAATATAQTSSSSSSAAATAARSAAPAMDADTARALQRAREAREALKKAQSYHAEDVVVDDDDEMDDAEDEDEDDDDIVVVVDDNVINGGSSSLGGTASRAPTQAASGPVIRLTLRTNGNASDTAVFKIRTGEVLRRLVDNYCSSNGYSSSGVSLTFDGQTLDLTRTAASYEMEDEDLIDVAVKKDQSKRSIGSSSSAVASSSQQRIVIVTKVKGMTDRRSSEHKYQIRRTDPFRKIVGAYCAQRRGRGGSGGGPDDVALEYRGRKLDLNSTPADEGLVDHATIDICDASALAAASSSGPQISIKFRINGKDATMQTYRIRQNEPFRRVVDEFCRKNGNLSNSSCSFVFDGELLNFDRTPSVLDMEGDEIVDVTVPESMLPSSLSSSNGTAAAAAAPTTTRAESRSSASSSSGPPTSLVPVILVDDNEKVPQTIFTVRNLNTRARPKKFQVFCCDTISTLKKGYVDYYKPKGCKKVQFYFNNVLIDDENLTTFKSLGAKDNDTLYAMENGRKFVPP